MLTEAVIWDVVNMKTYYYAGHSLTISQWAEKTGLTENTIRIRIRRGQSMEQVLSTPQGKSGGRQKKRDI